MTARRQELAGWALCNLDGTSDLVIHIQVRLAPTIRFLLDQLPRLERDLLDSGHLEARRVRVTVEVEEEP